MDLQSILAAILNPNGSQSAAGRMPPPVGMGVNEADRPIGLAQPAQGILAQHSMQAPQDQPPQTLAQPGAMPQPQGAPSGGLGDALGGFIQNIFDPQASGRNMTVGWLQKQGLDQGTATLLASNKPALQSYLLQRSKGSGPTEFDQRAEAARQYGLDPSTPEGRGFILTGKMAGADGGSTEYGLNPQYGIDANNNPVLVQIGKNGTSVQTKMPEGVALSKEPIKLDAGTHFVLLDPITRQPVGTIPKDLAGEEAAKAGGRIRGENEAGKPQAEAALSSTFSSLDRLATATDEIINDAALGKVTGLMGMLPNYPGGAAAGVQARLNTLKSQIGFTVLQAMRDASKTGGALGAISDKENELLQNNLAALDQAQSEDDLKRELGKIKEFVAGSKQRLQTAYDQTYGGGSSPSSSNAAPANAPQKASTSEPTADTPPASYEGNPELWKYMKPEQRKLWQ